MLNFQVKFSTLTLVLVHILHVKTTENAIQPDLIKKLQKEGYSNIIVTFKIRTNDTISRFVQETKSISNRVEKITKLSDELQKLATSTQKQVLDFVNRERANTKYCILWITNQLTIRNASFDLVNKIAAVSDVLEIRETRILQGMPISNVSNSNYSMSGISNPHPDFPSVNTWVVLQVKAPDVWEQGYDGTGVTVGIIDSGVRLNHDSLYDAYAGLKNNGWFDPERKSFSPRDDLGHGTSCLSVTVGQFGLGVAPGSKWMACLMYDSNLGWMEDYALQCFQFMICPTDHEGNNKDCSKSPRVINNSWSYGSEEDDSNMRMIIPIFEALDIVLVFSAGNEGSTCGSASAPANYKEFIGVGGSSFNDTYWRGSGAGPSRTDGSIKPDLVAPGYGVFVAGSARQGEYVTADGTSFSSPIVVGVIALMLQKNPRLTKDEIKEILYKSCDPLTTKQGPCGNVSNDVYPNNRAGYGRISALKAINNTP
ncbi:unnamed protein product [Allacma fusca]|uniref:Peptidase S8/S53 domain-containing protein n=1 Tax=Allacma fusca TaxID=39272 RepID=A0A8J2NZZ9_9HEXA|nr:unnamed protein product [Allacma fusca]